MIWDEAQRQAEQELWRQHSNDERPETGPDVDLLPLITLTLARLACLLKWQARRQLMMELTGASYGAVQWVNEMLKRTTEFGRMIAMIEVMLARSGYKSFGSLSTKPTKQL